MKCGVKKPRFIDLSHKLYPGKEEYNLEIKTHFVEELLPQYKRPKDVWYIMQEVTFWDHVGTHIESPYHYLKDGLNISQLPLERLIGEAIIIDFTHKKPDDAIEVNELKIFDNKILENDIVFIKTGLDKYYRTPNAHQRPFFTTEAIRWLVDKKISCLGVDCSGFEIRGIDDQPNHRILFEAGIPVIEELTNLNQLKKERVFVIIIPWNVDGMAASPVRVIAIEPVEKSAGDVGLIL